MAPEATDETVQVQELLLLRTSMVARLGHVATKDGKTSKSAAPPDPILR